MGDPAFAEKYYLEGDEIIYNDPLQVCGRNNLKEVVKNK